LQRQDARKIAVEDVVPEFEDVIVERVVPSKTKIKKL